MYNSNDLNDTDEVCVETVLGPVPGEALLKALKHEAGELLREPGTSIAILDGQLADLVQMAKNNDDHFTTLLALAMQVTIAQLKYHHERRFEFSRSEMERAFCGGHANEVLQHIVADYVRAGRSPFEAVKDQAGQFFSQSRASIETLDAQLADLVRTADRHDDRCVKMLAHSMQVTIAQVRNHNERHYAFTLSEMERAYCGLPCNLVLQHSLARQALASLPPVDDGRKEERSNAA